MTRTRANVAPSTDAVRTALERGAIESFHNVYHRLTRIWDQYKATFTEQEGLKAADWSASGGGVTYFFQSAVAYGMLDKTEGRYGWTDLGRHVMVGEITEEILGRLTEIVEALYQVLADQEWQHLGSKEELLPKYKLRQVHKAPERVKAFLASRPFFATARAGNVEEFKALLVASPVKKKGRRRASDTSPQPRPATEAVPPATSVVAAHTPVSAPGSVGSPDYVLILCPHCTGTGRVHARIR